MASTDCCCERSNLNMSADQTIMLILLQKIASVLGPGKIQKKPSEEAFLTKDLSV